MTTSGIARFMPKSLVGQLILVVVITLVVTQIIGAFIFADERRAALRTLGEGETLSRTASIARVISETPDNLHKRVLRAATSKRLKFWVSDVGAVPRQDLSFVNNRVAERLRALAEIPDTRAVLVDVREVDTSLFRNRWKREKERRHYRDDDDDDDDDDDHRWHRRHGPTSLLIAIELESGQWLNAENQFSAPPRGRFWAASSILACIIIVIAGVSLILLRRITGPMRQLSEAAEKLGRGEEVATLPESGPHEARATIRAFNQMQERLTRFMNDRTQMLAATSHDLRTPLTSLRLRAELVDDPELKFKMLATLDEMQKMVEAMLAFAREDSAHEETRDVDMGSLVQSIVDDLNDLGHDATLTPGAACVIRGRPFTLTRAIRNIIENASRHGGGAHVSFETRDKESVIIVEDNGPGIPENDLEHVFNPFVRLDQARNQESGNMGLGLGIARTIIRGHGGEIGITNRPEGGLRATIRLPNA